ncbi:hypothetical protein [Kitasatospora sp. NPDC058190]|uniref:hypothetical protein n=1 Tax=Kitasatospora sp. NPDC058190 TaxID=3346371 RepID=UPI0036DDB02D
MTTILSPPANPVSAPVPAASHGHPMDQLFAVPPIGFAPDVDGRRASRPAMDAPKTSSCPQLASAATPARGANADHHPVGTFLWALWMFGHVLVIALLRVTTNNQLDHQGVAHGLDPSRSAPDVGEA